MKKKLAKLTALILAGTLIFNGMSPISQAKNSDYGMMAETESGEDEYTYESSEEKNEEEPSDAEEISEEKTTETEETSEEETSEPEETSEEETTEPEETSEEETTEPEETSEEETTEEETTETEKIISITGIQLYDGGNLLYRSSDGTYYTNNNTLKVVIDITKTNVSDINIKINENNVEFKKEGDEYIIKGYNIGDDKELRICVEADDGVKDSETLSVMLDTTEPKAKIEHFGNAEKRALYIEEGDSDKYILYANSKDISVEINPSDDGSGISSVKAIVNDDKVIELGKDENKSSYLYNFSAVESVTDISYEITDNAGNKYEAAYNVYFDIEKPEIKLDVNEICIKMNEPLKLEVCDTESGILNVYMDDGTKGFTDQEGMYQYKFTDEDIDRENEVKECIIYAEDKAGNKAEKAVTLKFDFSAPQIDVNVSNSRNMETELYNDMNDSVKTYYTNTGCFIKVSATDEPNGGYASLVKDTILYEIVDGERREKNIPENGIIVVEFETDGKPKEYEVVATDNENNTSYDNFKIVYDNTRPEVEITISEKESTKDKFIEENLTGENAIEKKYYTNGVEVTVKVKDANFNSENVNFDITFQGEELISSGEWKSQSEGEYTYQATFTADGEYTFGFSCVDKAGNQSVSVKDENFIIDSEGPKITVEYDRNEPKNDKYYQGSRQATVTVKDGNFDESSASYRIKPSDSQEVWIPIQGTKQGEGQYTYIITFSEDEEYDFGFQCSDLAGNKSEYAEQSSFVIDTLAPEIKVDFSTGNSNNGKYYSAPRTATISITEKNFKEEYVEIASVNPEISDHLPAVSAWSTEGIVHTATIQFDSDGIYGFTVNCSDLAENQAKEYVSDVFVIDTTAPKAVIEYDLKEPINDKYYSTARTAVVTVTDANFDENNAQFIITSDGDKPVIGEWVHVPGDGCRNAIGHSSDCSYTCKVIFDRDGEYAFRFSCTDQAGNKSNVAEGGSFIIDTTEPDISVDFGNDKPQNGKYYNNSRTATITIRDKAFSDKLVNIEPLSGSDVNSIPAIIGWTSDGDEHTAKINFTEDGVYGFRITAGDLAGNAAKDYVGEIFIIDRTAPEIVFGGVRNNSANNGVVAPTLQYTDLNLDAAGTQVKLVGTNNGTIQGNVQKNSIENGVQMIYADFDHIQEMDDFYTLKVKAVDLAGNETEEELNFSVNRFGSTYRISVDTQRLLEDYYTGKAPVITITEINIDDLEYGEVTVSIDGKTSTLVAGSDYSVVKEGAGEDWKSYTYRVGADNFSKDGVYSVGFYSKDKAANMSDNRIKGKEIEFALDTTPPSIVAEGIESDTTYNESSKDITVDVKDNMYLTDLHVTDNGKTILEMSEKELKDNQGVVTFTLEEADELRDITITAKDIVGNEQKLEYNDIAITTKVEVIKEIEIVREVKPEAASVSPVIAIADEDNRLLYAVSMVMSAAVLVTAAGVCLRKKRKRTN